MDDSESRRARLLSALRLPLVELDADFKVVFQTDSPLELIIGESYIEQLPSEARPQAKSVLEQAVREGGRPVFSSMFDGRQFRTEVTRLGEEASGLCLVTHDVTEEARARLEGAEERQKLEVALNASKLGLWSWNFRTGVVIWDARMRQITGLPEPIDLATWIEELTHPDDRESFRELTGKAVSPGPLQPSTSRIVRPDGQTRWVLASGRILADASGEPTMMVGGTLDVTEQELMSERLRSAQRMEALGHLTAGVAHNFNNMLMVIAPCLECIQEQNPAGLEEDVQDAIDAAQRAADIVRELMTFAGQQNRKDRKLQSVAEMCAQTSRLCERSFPKGMELRTRLNCVGQSECVPGSIEQVLSNVLVNARDALVMSQTPTPFVSVEAQDVEHFGERWVEITISDNGPGIPEELRTKIFEPFMTTKHGKGTGLGLASSQALIEQHGGQLACKERVGGGTEFLILLPSQVKKASLTSVPPPSGPDSEVPSQRGLVLIVDDEPAIRRLVGRGLSRAGFQVETASDEDSARALISSRPEIRFVLLDRTLRHQDSLKLVPVVREVLPNASVFFFTGEHIREEELQLVDGLIQKPVSVPQLVLRIQETL